MVIHLSIMCFTKLAPKLDKLNQLMTKFNFGNDLIDKCDYLDHDEMIEVKISESDLSIIQWNVRGLMNKQSTVLNFINGCNKSEIDIVIVSETWLTSSSLSLVNIPGYDFVGEVHNHKKGGGVGFLINQSLQYKTRPDLKILDDELESCFIELKSDISTIIIGSLYRPPNTNQKSFIERIDNWLKQNKAHENIIILGMDHNMDLLKCDKNSNTQCFLETILDDSMFPLITRPMRITNDMPTLIGNILVSQDLYHKSHGGVLLSDLSDHLPCISIIKKMKSLKGETLKIRKRDLKPHNLKQVQEELKNINWHDILENQNASYQFDLFHEKLVESLNTHCPEKEHIVPTKCVIKEPWLTKGLLTACSKQIKLFKISLKR